MTAGATVLYAASTPVDGLRVALERADNAVSEAATVEEAQRALGAGIDCVVCGDGLDAGGLPAAVRAVDADGGPPIVAAPVDGNEELATCALGAGADDYVPCSPAGDHDRLVERVEAALEGADRASGGEKRDAGAAGDGGVERAVTDTGTPVPLESVAGSLSEVLVTIDGDSQVRYVNDAVADVFGYEPEELVGGPLTRIMPERFHAAHGEAVERYLTAGVRQLDWSSIELPGRHRDGHEVPLEISFGEFVHAGDRHFTGLIRDVSDRVEREQVLTDLHEATSEMLLAETPAAVAEIATAVAAEVLDLPITTVFRHDADAALLRPIASTDDAVDVLGEVPSLEAGNALAWETFEDGEMRVFEDVRDREQIHDETTPIRTELQVPLGDVGVLVSGTTERREFADDQLEFVELLGAITEAALERATRERALRRYETIFRAVDEPVCVLDADGTVRMANGPIAALVGHDRSDLLGSHVSRLLDADDLERVRERVLDGGAGTNTTAELQVETADGTRIPCEIDIATLPAEAGIDGVVAVVRDVRARKQVEAALEREQDRLASLFEHIPDPVVLARLDPDDGPLVQSINDAFADVFGVTAERIRGRSLNDVILPPADEDRAETLDDRARRGERVEAELRRRTDDGIRDFLFRGIPVDAEAGDAVEAFGIYTDITVQRTRQRRLGVLNRVLRHNLRTEMNVVGGSADVIADADVPSHVVDLAETISEAAANVARLGERVRSLEDALERGAEATDSRSLADVVEGAVERHRHAEGARIAVTIDAPSAVVDGRLELAVGHLVENALEHSDRERPSVTVRTDVDESTATVVVADDGPGIPEDERAVLERGEESALQHGSGIGLWLVEWIATAVGGSVAFEDGDRGSVVRLAVPRLDG